MDSDGGCRDLPDPTWCRELVATHAPDLMVVVDPDLRAVWTNDAVSRLIGLEHGEMMGSPVHEFVHPDDLEHAVGALGEAHRTDGYHVATRLRIRRVDGTYVDTRVTASTSTEPDGVWTVLALRPVEDEVAIERRRAQLKALAQSVYLNCAALHWYEEDERVAGMLGNLAAVVGARSVELARTGDDGQLEIAAAYVRNGSGALRPPNGTPFAAVGDLDHLRLRPCVLTTMDSVTGPPRLAADGVVVEIWAEDEIRSGGIARIGFESVSPDWDDANADIVSLMCSSLLTTMRRCQQERDVHRAATLDPLTRLLNRAALHDRLGVLLEQSRAAGTRPVVLFVDLNRFKQLNDRFGHREGDTVLRVVGEALVGVVRSGDVAARIGGDEFVAVFDAPEESAEALVARVRRAIDAAVSRWPEVSAAVGAIVVDATGTPDDVLEHADRAMYRDKASSRAGTASRDDLIPR